MTMTTQKPRPTQAMLKRFAILAKTQLRALLWGTFFLLIASGMGLAYPQAIRIIVDEVLGAKSEAMIDLAALAMLGIFAAQGIAGALRYYLFTTAGERVVTDLRDHLFQNVIGQEIGFFDARRTGELTNRLSSDTGILQNAVSVNISMGLRSLAMVLGGFGLLLYTSVSLTAAMILVVPPVALGAVWVGRKIRVLSRKTQDALARAGEVAEESIAGVRTVRIFGQEDEVSQKYRDAVDHAFDIARNRIRVVGLFLAGASFAAYASIAVVLWLGGKQVLTGQLSVGELTSFILYTLIVAFSLSTLGGLWADFMRAIGAGDRVFELMDRISEIPNRGGQILETVQGSMTFSGVDFAYPSRAEIDVLTGVSLALSPGEVVALVGPSGGGKSTVAALMSRLYDPTSGVVTLDGIDLRELDPTWLRAQVGVVAQEPMLFSTSVAANIRYGNPHATDEEVVNAANIANAHSFIEGFPEGYETMVGERGIQLSGGQKQRVAIARAVLKDPCLLVLDEATSALDTESEYLVQQALERLMQGRTTLVIAHRLSTVKQANRVVVIDAGRIVEEGTHTQLLEKGGLYGRLVERQLVGATSAA